MNPSGVAAVTTYREMQAAQRTAGGKVRDVARDIALFALAQFRSVPRDKEWIRFPYYHHVFPDERTGFAAQLRYMKNFGDFISMDDAVSALQSSDVQRGRYFCITFDDGFRNCLEHAVPILVEHGATAAFFLPTQFIGTSLPRDGELLRSFYEDGRTVVEFLSWDECRQMLAAGMSFGAHTVHHRRLSDLTAADAEWELGESKKAIEQRLGVPCRHFAAPFGIPGKDFLEERDPEIARNLGYVSFSTTRRGSFDRQSKPLGIERDHMLAGAPVRHLRYFLGE